VEAQYLAFAIEMKGNESGGEDKMEMLDTYVLTKLTLDSEGKVISTNVAVTFDVHEAEAHRNEDVSNDFQIFSVSADWRDDAEQSALVRAMREFREMVRQWQEEALR
jgi:hypothetical protein